MHEDETLISADVIVAACVDACVSAQGGLHEEHHVDPRDRLALLALLGAGARAARRAREPSMVRTGLRLVGGAGEELAWCTGLVWATGEHHLWTVQAASIEALCPRCGAPLYREGGTLHHALETQRPAAEQVSERRSRSRLSWSACEGAQPQG